MPERAGAGADDGVVGAMFEDADVAVVEAQHRAFRVAGEQHVAAAAQYQQRAVAGGGGRTAKPRAGNGRYPDDPP